MKKVILALAFYVILLPLKSQAAVVKDLPPEQNPVCWRMEACEETRAALSNISDKSKIDAMKKPPYEGWSQEDPCGPAGDPKGWGKCLPVGKTTTEIAFGGKTDFKDIGDFFKSNYNLALNIAGILAVIMIVVAGVQWTVSGGNSEAISAAKSRIGGALIGLVIAYLSYTILNTINPALVNLRLPQNWMIRPFKVGPDWCRDSDETSFAVGPTKDVDTKTINWQKALEDAAKGGYKPIPTSTMKCGDRFFGENSGQASCMGDFCGKDEGMCMSVSIDDSGNVNTAKPSCSKHDLIVHFAVDPTIMGVIKDQISWWTSTLESNWMNDTVVFWGVCQLDDGTLYLGKSIFGGYPNYYVPWGGPNGDLKLFPPIEKQPFKEYYLTVDNLIKDESGNDRGRDFWGCNVQTLDGKLVGLVMENEMKKTSLWFGGADPNFYVSPSYVGRWISISRNGYLDIEKIKHGLYVNAILGTNEAEYLADHPVSSPSPDVLYKDGVKANGEVTNAVLKTHSGGSTDYTPGEPTPAPSIDNP